MNKRRVAAVSGAETLMGELEGGHWRRHLRPGGGGVTRGGVQLQMEREKWALGALGEPVLGRDWVVGK